MSRASFSRRAWKSFIADSKAAICLAPLGAVPDAAAGLAAAFAENFGGAALEITGTAFAGLLGAGSGAFAFLGAWGLVMRFSTFFGLTATVFFLTGMANVCRFYHTLLYGCKRPYSVVLPAPRPPRTRGDGSGGSSKLICHLRGVSGLTIWLLSICPRMA